jgi:alpha-L-arabinofuranosidase
MRLPRLTLFLLPVIVTAQNVTINVDANQVVRTVDERVFGANAVIWDGNAAAAQTITMLQAAGLRALRIPGGSLSDEYHWRTNTTLANTWTWSAHYPAFINVITALNTQTYATVNYGTGTPEEAAALVAYLNASPTATPNSIDTVIGTDAKGYDWKTAAVWANLRGAAPLGTNDGMNFLRISRQAAVGIKYWEIGNECYGTWETDEQPVPHDPYTYAVRAKDYIAKMKAVDPSIKIGVVVVTGETTNTNNTSHPATNPRTGAVRNGWTPVMLTTLKQIGVTPDFIIYHRYDQAPGQETDAFLLQSAKTWPNDIADLRQQLTDYLGAAGAGVEIVVTENNSVYSDPGKQSTSVVNGLFMADSIGNLLQTEANALLWWDIRNGTPKNTAGQIVGNLSTSLYGWRNYGDYGMISSATAGGNSSNFEGYPTYYVMKLLSKFARGGDAVVKTTSSNNLLTVFSAKRTDGALTLLVINKDPTTTLTGNITLAGFVPPATANVYAYGMTQDNAARPGGSGLVDITATGMTVEGTTFSAAFEPYSATVISLGGTGTPLPVPTPTPTPAPTPTPTPAPTPAPSSGGGGGGGGAPSLWFVGAMVFLAVLRRPGRPIRT